VAQKRFRRRQRCFVQICTKRRHFTVNFFWLLFPLRQIYGVNNVFAIENASDISFR